MGVGSGPDCHMLVTAITSFIYTCEQDSSLHMYRGVTVYLGLVLVFFVS